MPKNNNKSTMLVAAVGLFSTITVGVVSNLDRIFPRAVEPNSTPQTQTTSTSASKVTTTHAPKSEPDMTRAEYDQIQTGMTYEEVVSIVGSPGTRVSANGPFTTYAWDDGGPFGAKIVFSGNNVHMLGPHGHGSNLFNSF